MPGEMSRQQQGRMLAPRPPLAAYREDLARRGTREAFGPSDATWISVATVLSHGVSVAPEDRPPLLATLREIVGNDPGLRDVLDDADEPPSNEFELDAVSPIVRAIVSRMEDEGALSLAYSTLTILADADLRLSTMERGRVAAQLGRVSWKSGALDTSREHYRRAEVLGRTARIPELRVRAWIGYGVVARHRGNYPEVRKWGARAADQAERAGLPMLASLAYHTLAVAAAVAGDLNAALIYGWRSYQGAAGDRGREASALLRLAQTLLEAGYPDAAIRGYFATLDRKPVARVAFPTLGGLSLAAARVGNRALVRETKARVEEMIASTPLPYECAGALLELSEALATIGDIADASDCRARALELAERHRYHEIIHRLESLQIAPAAIRAKAPHVLDPTGTEVVLAVASLEFAGTAKDAG
jgi:tetratricopeptide (TPR) repeat protein